VKVVIDTNVFISGVFFTGPPSKILEAWRDERRELREGEAREASPGFQCYQKSMQVLRTELAFGTSNPIAASPMANSWGRTSLTRFSNPSPMP